MATEKQLIYMEDTMDKLRVYAERKHEAGHIELANGILKAVNYIRNNIVRVDAVEVVHAHWVEDDMCCRRYCSACGFELHDDACNDMYGDYQIKPKYCPDCGAKMDGERRDNGKTD